MIDPNNDGVTHINIYSKAKTELGRFLSNFADCNVETEDGRFRTIEGYWYWLGLKLGTPDREQLRVTNGFDSKFIGRIMRSPDWNDQPDFQRKILNAIATKILSNVEMKKALRQSTLPLVHYYVYGAKVIEVKDGLWIISFLEFLRQDLNERDLD